MGIQEEERKRERLRSKRTRIKAKRTRKRKTRRKSAERMTLKVKMDYMLCVNAVIKYSINTRLWHYCSTAAPEEEVSVNCKCEGFKGDIYGTENE